MNENISNAKLTREKTDHHRQKQQQQIASNAKKKTKETATATNRQTKEAISLEIFLTKRRGVTKTPHEMHITQK